MVVPALRTTVAVCVLGLSVLLMTGCSREYYRAKFEDPPTIVEEHTVAEEPESTPWLTDSVPDPDAVADELCH